MKKIWLNLHIKFTMIRLSIFKNLHAITFALLGLIVFLIIGGVIDENTPILGLLFGGLSEGFNSCWNDLQCADVVSALTPIIAVLYSICTLVTKFRAIGLSDIKSDKIKLMIIRANLVLYNGFLISREKYNRIKNTEKVAQTEANIITNTINSAVELGTILTAKVDTETSDAELLSKSNTALIEEELTEVENASFFRKMLNGLISAVKHIGIAIVDIINIFRKPNDDDDVEDKMVENETVNKTDNTKENITVKSNNIETVEPIEDETVEIIPTVEEVTTDPVENTELVKNTNATITEDLVDAVDKADDAHVDLINNLNSNLTTMSNGLSTVKNTVSNQKVQQRKNQKSNAASLLSKLNSHNNE